MEKAVIYFKIDEDKKRDFQIKLIKKGYKTMIDFFEEKLNEFLEEKEE